MNFNSAEERIRELEVGGKINLYTAEDGSQIFVKKPENVPSQLRRKIPPALNFQIFLNPPRDEEFRPNHLRVLIDYHLKKKSEKNLYKELLSSVEAIYRGKDPENQLQKFNSYNFPMQIDPLDVTFYLTQLFMIEQEITWGKGTEYGSKYEPPRLFFLGYVRMVFDEAKEIDKICWGAANRNQPLVGYTKYNNKKRDEFSEEKDKLWYLST